MACTCEPTAMEAFARCRYRFLAFEDGSLRYRMCATDTNAHSQNRPAKIRPDVSNGVYPKNLVAFDSMQFRKVVMPARLRLSWGMKTFKLFLLPVLESIEFGSQVIRYALICVSVFFRQRASLGFEMLAMRSQLSFYQESIRQKTQPRPRF